MRLFQNRLLRPRVVPFNCGANVQLGEQHPIDTCIATTLLMIGRVCVRIDFGDQCLPKLFPEQKMIISPDENQLK